MTLYKLQEDQGGEGGRANLGERRGECNEWKKVGSGGGEGKEGKRG